MAVDYLERARKKQEFFSKLAALQASQLGKALKPSKKLADEVVKLYYECWPNAKKWAEAQQKKK